MIHLTRIIRIVPVPDMDDGERAGILRALPAHQLSDRSRIGIGAEQAQHFLSPDVQLVGERIVRADEIDEVSLQALGDEDGE